jgi:uncharacterized membrane protein YsdA (DUF1294 family)/cold shock CspA family protein
MRYKGKISRWVDDRGFGFITPSGGGKEVFVHIKSFSRQGRRPVGSEVVTYELKRDSGRTQAANVAFWSENIAGVVISRKRGVVALPFAGLFLAFVAAAVFTRKLPFAILALYMIASTVAFIAYARDKSAARKDEWRTPESTLHLLGIIGGWPGALAAQSLLRHKSKKQSFIVPFWATVVANCVALCWLLSSSSLRSITGAL